MSSVAIQESIISPPPTLQQESITTESNMDANLELSASTGPTAADLSSKSDSSPEPYQLEPDAEPVMPNLSDMPLHEWIAALTHPVTGQFPNGITTRMMDALVKQLGVTEFPSADRRRYHTIWKSIGHFAVHLSEAARKGRVRRVSLGTYMGLFRHGEADFQNGTIAEVPDAAINTEPYQSRPFARTVSSSKRKSFLPQRHPFGVGSSKRVCASADTPAGDTTLQNDRPPSCNSIDGGSGSSTDGCPVNQLGEKILNRRKGRKFKKGPAGASSNGSGVGKQPKAVKQFSSTSADTIPKLSKEVENENKFASLVCKSNILNRGRREEFDEFGLPSLLKIEPNLKTATVESIGSLSSQDIARLCEKVGFDEEAKALFREEVDGTALLLLTREDIVNNLGLRLGPALKLHRFVRMLQQIAKGSMNRSGAA